MAQLAFADDIARAAGRLTESRASAAAAFGEAVARDDSSGMAAAALAYCGVWVQEHRGSVERSRMEAWLSAALARLPSDDPLAVRIRVRLMCEAAFAAARVDDARLALDLARSHGCQVALAEALSLVHHCMLGPDHADERMRLADELLMVAALTGRPQDRLMGLLWRTVDLFLAGDVRAERSLRDLRDHLAVDDFVAIRYVAEAIEVMRLVRLGRLDEAEAAALAAYDLGVEVGDADARGFLGAQLIAIRWGQRRSAEVLDLIVDLASCPTLMESNDAILAAVATLAADCGRHDLARSTLAEIRRRPLETTRTTSVWLALLVGVIDAASVLGDAEVAAEAYALLRPFADRPVMASLAVACFGSAHRSLGIAAETFGNPDLAIEHLRAAVADNERLGHLPAVERSNEALQRLLARRVPKVISLTRRQDVWTVALGNRSCAVAHSVGLEYLARLVERPGTWVRATVLAERVVDDAGRSPQPVLDRRAVAAYREQLERLRLRRDAAEDAGDVAVAVEAQAEYDALAEELGRGRGLGGRSRCFAGEGERARVAVQKALRRAVVRIREADDAIGAHVAASIETGAQCRYVLR